MYMLQRVFINNKALKLIGGEGSNGIFRTIYTVHAVPPRKKISFGEKCVQYVFLTLCSWAYPFWVMYHIKEYQGQTK